MPPYSAPASVGNRSAAAVMPTHNGDSVISHTSHAMVMRWIHVPVSDIAVPPM